MTSDPAPRTLRIEVVYALREEQALVTLEMAEGATARHAVVLSGILQRFPALAGATIGIFGRVAGPDALLEDGDRVEIYRPLMADPKDARRTRARRRR